MKTVRNIFREAIQKRMRELGIENPNALHERVRDRRVNRSQLYRFLAGKVDMGGDHLSELFRELGLVVVPIEHLKWKSENWEMGAN